MVLADNQIPDMGNSNLKNPWKQRALQHKEASNLLLKFRIGPSISICLHYDEPRKKYITSNFQIKECEVPPKLLAEPYTTAWCEVSKPLLNFLELLVTTQPNMQTMFRIISVAHCNTTFTSILGRVILSIHA